MKQKNRTHRYVLYCTNLNEKHLCLLVFHDNYQPAQYQALYAPVYCTVNKLLHIHSAVTLILKELDTEVIYDTPTLP